MSFFESLFAGFKKFASVVEMLLPIVSAFVPGAAIPAAGVKILEKLPALMATADELFTEVGQGALKKQFVMTAAKQVAATVADISTGGQADTWNNEIAPNLSVIIDTAVAIANVASPNIVVDDQVLKATI